MISSANARQDATDNNILAGLASDVGHAIGEDKIPARFSLAVSLSNTRTCAGATGAGRINMDKEGRLLLHTCNETTRLRDSDV